MTILEARVKTSFATRWVFRLRNQMSVFLLTIVAFFSGCGLPDSKYLTDELHLGNYPPPPPGFEKIQIAVRQFQDKRKPSQTRILPTVSTLQFQSPSIFKGDTDLSKSSIPRDAYVNDLASPITDMAITFLYKSGRFQVMERDRLWEILTKAHGQKLLFPEKKQLGARFIMTGSLTQFEVREAVNYYTVPIGLMVAIGLAAARVNTGVSPWLIGALIGNLDMADKTLNVDIGLDGRIINVETGEVIISESVEVRREEYAGAFSFIGFSSKGEFHIDVTSAGRQLRFAVDALIRKIIEEMDKKRVF